jgi:GH24 family phage-related lysozyme (muramidase)
MEDNQALTGRPELRPTLQPQRTQVVARVNEHSSAAAAVNPDLLGLVQGLQALNPALQKYTELRTADQRDTTAELADAQAAREPSPRDALTGAPAAVPSDVPPAFDALYQARYKNTLMQRASLQTATDITAQYEDQKDLPDFNVKAFLAEQRSKALGGLQDPQQVATMGAHLDEVAQRIQAADTAKLVTRHEADRKQTMAEIATNGLTLDQSPHELAEKAHWLIDQGAAIQVHPETAAKSVLQRLATMSQQAGGKPELFNVFDAPSADGRTLRMLAPDLSEAVDAHKQQATAQRAQAIHEATEGNRYDTRVKLDRMVDETPEAVTESFVKDYVGKNSLTAEQGASYVNQARDKLAHKALTDEAMTAYDAGMLGRYEPEVQKKVLEAKMGPTITAAWKVFANGANVPEKDRQSTVQALAESIIGAHSKARASVPVDALTRLFGTSVTSMPNPEGPSAGFQATAALYKALGGAPQYRDLYFKGEADDILRTFNAQVADFGRDPKTAYENAYMANSPEAKAAGAKEAEKPEFAAKVEEVARAAVSGSTWARLWGGALGFNGRPQNDTEVGGWVSQRARELLRTSPYLSQEDVIAKAEKMARDNWVMDSATRRAIQVPAGQGGERTGEAFSDFTQSIIEGLQKKGQFPDGSWVRYSPVGDTGMYTVKVVNGSDEKTMDQVSIQEVTRRFDMKTHLQPEEAKQLRAVVQALRGGQPVGTVDPALIAKGKSSGYLSSTDIGLLDVQQHKTVMEKLTGGPQFNLGQPANSNTLEVRRGAVRVDPKLTTRTALGLAFGDDSGNVPGADHVKLAASLAAVREGVVLTAYADPARGAGLNIGAGYNLKGNAATVADDLRAVGVSPDRLEDIKAGRAALTPDQAKWLTQLTMQRVDRQVKKVAEAVKPGLWASLSAPQRAVMLDVAYQTGDAGQYRKAWDALAKGDTQALRSELRTYFTNQQGQRTEDTRALDLRASLLQGLPSWKARLTVSK